MLVSAVFTSFRAVQDFWLLRLLKACLTLLVPQKLVLREALIQITNSFALLGGRHSEQTSVYTLHQWSKDFMLLMISAQMARSLTAVT